MSEGAEPEAIRLAVPPHVTPEGVYVNGCAAWDTRVDIIIDFFCGPVAPDDDSQVLVSRIRLAPQTAEALLHNLNDAMERHVAMNDLPTVPPSGEQE